MLLAFPPTLSVPHHPSMVCSLTPSSSYHLGGSSELLQQVILSEELSGTSSYEMILSAVNAVDAKRSYKSFDALKICGQPVMIVLIRAFGVN